MQIIQNLKRIALPILMQTRSISTEDLKLTSPKSSDLRFVFVLHFLADISFLWLARGHRSEGKCQFLPATTSNRQNASRDRTEWNKDGWHFENEEEDEDFIVLLHNSVKYTMFKNYNCVCLLLLFQAELEFVFNSMGADRQIQSQNHVTSSPLLK